MVRDAVGQTATRATREWVARGLRVDATPADAARAAPDLAPGLVRLLEDMHTAVTTYVGRRRDEGAPVQRVLPEVEALVRGAVCGAELREVAELLVTHAVRWSSKAYDAPYAPDDASHAAPPHRRTRGSKAVVFLRVAEPPAPLRRPAALTADAARAARDAACAARDAAEEARTRAEVARNVAEAARDVARADADDLGEQLAFLQEQLRGARAYHVEVVETERAVHHAEVEILLQEMDTMRQELDGRAQRVECREARAGATHMGAAAVGEGETAAGRVV